MTAPSTFTLKEWGKDALRNVNDFVAQVARTLDGRLTFEENSRAEWRDLVWIAGQTADLKIATTITQPRAVLLAHVRPEQVVSYEDHVRGVITTDGAGAVSIADAGTGDWSVAIVSSVLEVTLSPAMADTTYVPDGRVLSTTHRFGVPEVVSASLFRLRFWNASAAPIAPDTNALTVGFDVFGRRLGRPVGTATLEWDRADGGIVVRAIDGLVDGQRYQVRLLVVER